MPYIIVNNDLREKIKYNVTEYTSKYTIAATELKSGKLKSNPIFEIVDFDSIDWIGDYVFIQDSEHDTGNIYYKLQLFNINENNTSEARIANLQIRYKTLPQNTNNILLVLTQDKKDTMILIKNCAITILKYKEYCIVNINLENENNLNTWYLYDIEQNTETEMNLDNGIISNYIPALRNIDNNENYNKTIILSNNVYNTAKPNNIQDSNFSLISNQIIGIRTQQPLKISDTLDKYNFFFNFNKQEILDFSQLYLFLKLKITNIQGIIIDEQNTYKLKLKNTVITDENDLLTYIHLEMLGNGHTQNEYEDRKNFFAQYNNTQISIQIDMNAYINDNSYTGKKDIQVRCTLYYEKKSDNIYKYALDENGINKITNEVNLNDTIDDYFQLTNYINNYGGSPNNIEIKSFNTFNAFPNNMFNLTVIEVN